MAAQDELDVLNQTSLPPDLMAAQQQLNTQQRMAQMLMQQNQQPQGQMISGRYVAPAWTQMLQPVANMLAGAYLSKQGDERATKLAQQIRDLSATESANIFAKQQGTPARSEELAGPAYQGVKPSIEYEAQPGSKEAAYLEAVKGYTPASKEMASVLRKHLLQEPIWEKTSIKQGGQEIQGVYDKRNPDVMATFRPYNASMDIPLATAQYSGIVPKNSAVGGSNFVNQAQGAGLPIISGVRTPIEQAELRHHRDPATGQWLTKEGRPVAENSAHLTGNAIDLNPKTPLTTEQQTWLSQNAYQPNPTKDANHWELKPGAAGQMPQAEAIGKSKYDLEVPKQFNTPKERDEWFAKSREPLTGEPLKMVTGAENTIGALRNFNQAIQGFNKADMVNPDKAAAMYGLTKNAILALKDAKGLGVLNKEDLPQLEAILRDPTDWKNILNSKELFQKLANRQIEYAGGVIANNYKNSYKQLPDEKKNLLLQIDAEVAQQNKPKAPDLSKPVVYNSQSAAQAAGKAGKLQDGQKVVIGGQVYSWRND